VATHERGFLRVGGACGIAAGILIVVGLVLAFYTPQFPSADSEGSLRAVGQDPMGFLLGTAPFVALPFLIIAGVVGFYRGMNNGRGGFALVGAGLSVAGSTILAIGIVVRIFSGLALAYLYTAVIESQQPLVVGLAEVVGLFLVWGFLALPFAFFGVGQIAFGGAMLGGPIPKAYGAASIVLGIVTIAGNFVLLGLPTVASLAIWFILVGQKVYRPLGRPEGKRLEPV